MAQVGFYSFYNMGRFNGTGPNLIMFRMHKPDGSFGSCHVVEEHAAAANREALIRNGYAPLASRAA